MLYNYIILHLFSLSAIPGHPLPLSVVAAPAVAYHPLRQVSSRRRHRELLFHPSRRCPSLPSLAGVAAPPHPARAAASPPPVRQRQLIDKAGDGEESLTCGVGFFW